MTDQESQDSVVHDHEVPPSNVSPSPSKRLKVTEMKKKINLAQRNQNEFSIILVRGGFELISCSKEEGQNAFTNRLDEAIKNSEHIMRQWKLVAVGTRCKEGNPNIMLQNKFDTYRRKYLIRSLDREDNGEYISSSESRKKVLLFLANVSLLSFLCKS